MYPLQVHTSHGVCDSFGAQLDGDDYEGYVCGGLNIGSGDYIEITVCANCGHVQGQWPLPMNPLHDEDENCQFINLH